MATFLGTYGAAPRQTPQLQNWLTLLATYIDADLGNANLYHSTSGIPTVPTDLDALFASTPVIDTVVFWTDTSTGFTYTYIYDVSSDTWIAGPNTVVAAGSPAGTLLPFAGDGTAAAALAPDYLLCYGQAISRATYADLFAVVGTTYGSGDGSTTFNLPDLRGRVPAGLDNMGGSSANRVTDSAADSIGGVAGTETHTLTVAELPEHTHDINRAVNTSGGSNWIASVSTATLPAVTKVADTVAAGSGNAHANVQPSMFVNYLIKT